MCAASILRTMLETDPRSYTGDIYFVSHNAKESKFVLQKVGGCVIIQVNHPSFGGVMSKGKITELFRDPPTDYKGKPFWSWNGELDREELIRQTHIMKEMGFGGHFMHSRAGLVTEYLGDEWFEHINAVADESESIGLEAWLYDEDRYPSGSGGGLVTKDERYRCKSIVNHEISHENFTWSAGVYAAFVAKICGSDIYAYKRIFECDDIDAAIKSQEDTAASLPGEWKVLYYTKGPYPVNTNFNDGSPLDTISREAVAKFIEVTHEKYKEKCGDRLGRSIKGIFTDEPRRFDSIHFDFSNPRERFGATCWTEELESEFEKRYGYNFIDKIPELFYCPMGEKVAPIKLHYFNLTCDLFCENYAKQIRDWCHENNIIFTGHGLEEESLRTQIICMGSIMRLYEYMDWPGMDELTESERKYWVPKQLASVVRQLGKDRMLSELYGCTGWQFNFRSHKAVGDWQALFGVNFRCHHLSWYTMEGQAKRDYPASIFHQSPWYKHYGRVEDYFNRFNAYNLEGRPACDVLLLNPIESMFCQIYIGWHDWNKQEITSAACAEIERKYRETFFMLTENHIDFDWGEEAIMARHWSLGRDEEGNALLNIGKMAYRVVIVSNMTTIRPSTVKMLREFMDMGGKVIIMGEEPKYIDAVAYDGEFALAIGALHIDYDEKSLVDAIRSTSCEYVDVLNADGETLKDVFVQSKHDFDGDDAFVVLNTDLDNAKYGISIAFKTESPRNVEIWDFATGEQYCADRRAHFENGCTVIETDLLAGETQCYVLRKKKDESLSIEQVLEDIEIIPTYDALEYTLDEKNVCVLDFAHWKREGEEWSEEKKEILQIDRLIRNEHKFMRRCEGMLQPWFVKKHMLDTVAEEIEIKFDFIIEKMPEGEIILACERPELNEYYVNGVKLSCPDENDFWIDICFKKLPIPKSALKIGENCVVVKTLYKFSSHLESVYLVGDFGVVAGHKTSQITDPLPQKLDFKSFKNQGLPFYSGNVTFKLSADEIKKKVSVSRGDRVFLSAKFHGAAVRVTSEVGIDEIIAWEPYDCDVTEAVLCEKDIYVTLLGTRKNTFGPLHVVPCVVHRCGHGSFTTEGDDWTDEYNLIEDGLREIRFTIKR